MKLDLPAPQTAGTRRAGMVTYATACAAVVAIIFLTNWPTYRYTVYGGMIPLYYYILPGLMIVPLLLAEPQAAVRFLRDPLLWWFFAFVLTGLVWLLLAQDFLEEASRQWRLRLLALMFIYSITLLASEAQQRVLAWVIVACVVVSCAFNWFDVLRPYRFVPRGIEGASEGRGAGLYINPNAAASFIVAGAIASLAFLPSRLRGLLLVCCVFGVAATFSRGGFVMITTATLGAMALRLMSRAQAMLLLVTLPLLIGGVSLAYDYLISASESQHIHTVLQRLAWFQEPADEDFAVEGRKQGAANAWQIFLEHPVTGGGTGATSRAILLEGPHNMYLLLMAEQGFLGLALYVSLVWLLIQRGWRGMRRSPSARDRDVFATLVLFGVYLAVYGFFSHNVLEEPQTMFVLAFVIAAGFARTSRVPVVQVRTTGAVPRSMARRST